MTAGAPIRLFVPPGAIAGDRLMLGGMEAARAYWLGVRPGDSIVVLDGSGWSWTAVVETCLQAECGGRLVSRSLAEERRTKVTLCCGLLHPYDYRRLLVAATMAGVVAFVPVVSDASPVSAMPASGEADEPGSWQRLVRDAAEKANRGRLPSVSPPMLLDQALDDMQRSGTVLLLAPGGLATEAALARRPFSIGLFCPPFGGFTAPELELARRRGGTVVDMPEGDPVRSALVALGAIYSLLEEQPGSAQDGGALA